MTRRTLFTVGCVISITLAFLLTCNQVDNTITDEDLVYINKIMDANNVVDVQSTRSYSDEINFLKNIQRATLKIAPIDDGIPFSMTREPKDVYQYGKGLCYDRSRVIEKIAKNKGFKTRHISLYSLGNHRSIFVPLITPDNPSHAISEILTQKGWLVVDSNSPWVSLDINGRPVSIESMNNAAGQESVIWKDTRIPEIYTRPFTYIYGLYSRHGYFYPPYNIIPDVNYGELLQNKTRLILGMVGYTDRINKNSVTNHLQNQTM